MDNPTAGMGTPDVDGGCADPAAIVESLLWCVGEISRGHGRWDDPRAHGPGLYFVVETEPATAFTEPMGTNRWPVEDCASVFADPDALVETARRVAFDSDGAVVVHEDASIAAEMVRLAQLSPAEREQLGGLPYAGWMGARHMSALETSTRAEIHTAITLSEEDGRTTVFTDGTFEDHPREATGDE